MTVPVISLQGVWSRYSDAYIHRDLNLDVLPGQVIALVGGSGSGKTTLLREVLGLLRPVRGRVLLFGVDVADPDQDRQRALRRRIGVLFQHGALFSALNVHDNIAFALRELKMLDEAWITDLVNLKLAMVGLERRHGKLMPAELSGGMIKRVALARALALEPELLLLDEPTSGLDPDRSEAFVRLIGGLQSELGFTVMLVTHDVATLAGLATHVAALADQTIVAHGTVDAVRNSPHPFVRNFFGIERDPDVI